MQWIYLFNWEKTNTGIVSHTKAIYKCNQEKTTTFTKEKKSVDY